MVYHKRKGEKIIGAVYEIIQNIAIYLILVTIILNLIGDSSYKKYVELVCGMILILILLTPLTKVFALDETFFYNWNLSSYQMNSMDKSKILAAEEKQQEKLQQEYTSSLKEQIKIIVEKEGRFLSDAQIEYDKKSQGTIKNLQVWIAPEKTEEKKEDISIAPIVISKDNSDEEQEKGKVASQMEENIQKALMKTYQLKKEQVKVYEADI